MSKGSVETVAFRQVCSKRHGFADQERTQIEQKIAHTSRTPELFPHFLLDTARLISSMVWLAACNYALGHMKKSSRGKEMVLSYEELRRLCLLAARSMD